MPTSTSDIDIVNLALGLSGARSTVTSFAENTPESQQARIWYPRDRLYMLRAHRWNFARFQGPLTLLATAPGVAAEPATGLPWPFMPWAYSYAYPDNCAKFNFILPTFNGSPVQSVPFGLAQPVIPFVVSSYDNPSNQPVEAIFTNQVTAYGVWTRDITSPALFDSMFVEAFSYRLAGSMSMALNGLSPLVNSLYAKGEAMIEQANAQDGNEGTRTMNSIPDWLRVRGYAADWQWWPNDSWGQGGGGWGGGWGI